MSESADITAVSVHFCGLELDIYGTGETLRTLDIAEGGHAAASKPVDILIFVHGREQSKQAIGKKCAALAAAGCSPTRTADLLVVTFDLPNHGKRVHDASRNRSWAEGNMDHGMDMWGCICLALGEIRLMLDLLPTLLGHPVRRWAVGGISLGGHITALALAEDPRIQMGIVAIGSGNLHRRYMDIVQPYSLPERKMRDVLSQLAERDATYHIDRVAHAKGERGPLSSRWIMVLHGEQDDIVTYASNQPFIRALEERMTKALDAAHEAMLADSAVNPLRAVCNAAIEDGDDAAVEACAQPVNGRLRVNIYPGVKHVVNAAMLQAMCRWIEEWMQTSPEQPFLAAEHDQRAHKL